jgi:predicted PolB exonuclease-like 3'-5' exonuclease
MPLVTSYLVFDIETVVDPDLPIAEGTDAQKIPATPHHQIVALGALLLSGPDYEPKRLGIVGRDSTDERVILLEFTELVEKHAPTLVTFNGRGFDLPVIAARCLHHGVPFRTYYRRRGMRYRFTEEDHFDLMDFLSDFGATRPARLDVMAKLIGMPGKVGVDGKDVGPLIHKGRVEEVRDYCLCDVVQTAALFLRVELLRGAIDRPKYVTAARALLRHLSTHPRVHAALWEHIDLERFLLGEGLEEATEQPGAALAH